MDNKEETIHLSVYIASQKKNSIIQIEKEYPLYPIIAYLNKCLKNPTRLDYLSSEKINYVKDDFLKTLSGINKISFTKKKYIDKYRYCLEWIEQAVLLIAKNTPCKIKSTIDLTEFLYDVMKAYRKKIDFQVKNKGIIKNSIDNCLSEYMSIIAALYLKNKDLQSAETWSLRHLLWLDKIQNKDPSDIAKRKFNEKLNLANIYYEWGYPESALKLIQEANVYIKTKYNNEFDFFLVDMSEFCKKASKYYFENRKFDLSMEIAHAFLSMLKDLPTGSLTENANKITTWEDNKKYISFSYKLAAAQQQQILKSVFDSFKGLIDLLPFKFDNEKGNIQITPLHSDDFYFLKKQLKSLGIHYTTNGQYLEFYTFNCPKEQLNSLLESFSNFLKNKKVPDKIFTSSSSQGFFALQDKSIAPIAEPNISLSTAISTTNPTTITTTTTTTAHATPTTTTTTTTASTATTTTTTTSNATATTTTTTSDTSTNKKDQAKKYNAPRSFTWPNTNLVYRSSDENTGTVKSLNSDYMPNEAWFGYIPDWVYRDEHYNSEFVDRVIRGKLSTDHIRDITKELKANNKEALNYDNRYKYKIVIPGTNYRLYGWIEEVIIDADGKKRHLVCFGHLEDYHNKPLNLPDPKTIKNKELKHSLNQTNVKLSKS